MGHLPELPEQKTFESKEMAEARKSLRQPAGCGRPHRGSGPGGHLRGDKGKSLVQQEPSPSTWRQAPAAEMLAETDFWRRLYNSGPDPEVFLIQNPQSERALLICEVCAIGTFPIAQPTTNIWPKASGTEELSL